MKLKLRKRQLKRKELMAIKAQYNIYSLFFPVKIKYSIKKAKPIIEEPGAPEPLNSRKHIDL